MIDYFSKCPKKAPKDFEKTEV